MANSKIEKFNKERTSYLVEITGKDFYHRYTLITKLKKGYVENAIATLLEKLEELSDE